MVMRAQQRGNERRAAIYAVISDSWIHGRSSPTIRDIAKETKTSVATVHRHVQILLGQGFLQGKGRTLRPGPSAGVG